MIRRGLADDRAGAEAAVRAGMVTVGGAPATNAATLVDPSVAVRVEEPSREYVSRGGQKLAAALSRFGVDPSDRDCLDAGASAGGFTDCLLRAGAARVAAVDVGYGVLAWSLRGDERVTVLERTNVRFLDRTSLPFVPSLVVADLSFISLRTAAPSLVALTSDGGELLLLVKPQFELSPAVVGAGGIVREPDGWRRAIEGVATTCERVGAAAIGVMPSPILGRGGNVEFFVHARVGAAASPLEVDKAIREAGEPAR